MAQRVRQWRIKPHMFSNLLILLYASFFLFNRGFIKFNSSLWGLSVSTDENVCMKKALPGNTPYLQSSTVRAPCSPGCWRKPLFPLGKQSKLGNTLGTTSGCETLARHSLQSEEWVGLSSGVWGTHWPRFPADLGLCFLEPGGKATCFSSPFLPPPQLGNCPNLCHLLKVPWKPWANVSWNPTPWSKQVPSLHTATKTKLQVGPKYTILSSSSTESDFLQQDRLPWHRATLI